MACIKVMNLLICSQEGLKASGITYDVVSNIPKVGYAISLRNE